MVLPFSSWTKSALGCVVEGSACFVCPSPQMFRASPRAQVHTNMRVASCCKKRDASLWWPWCFATWRSCELKDSTRFCDAAWPTLTWLIQPQNHVASQTPPAFPPLFLKYVRWKYFTNALSRFMEMEDVMEMEDY